MIKIDHYKHNSHCKIKSYTSVRRHTQMNCSQGMLNLDWEDEHDFGI